MKRLMVFRHAKSAWDDPDLDDHDRPLSPRGRRAAERMMEYLKQEEVVPSVILCSTAVRARETLDLIRPALPETSTIEIEAELYGATSSELIVRFRDLPNDADSVLIVGHNPGLQDLVVELASESDRLDDVRTKFPTAALAILDAPIDEWSQLSSGEASLAVFVTPGSLET